MTRLTLRELGQSSLVAEIAALHEVSPAYVSKVAQAKAEADIKIAEARGRAESTLVEARAQADSNRILSESITPELVRYRSIDKWNGELPRFHGGGGPVPFIDVGAAR